MGEDSAARDESMRRISVKTLPLMGLLNVTYGRVQAVEMERNEQDRWRAATFSKD